MIRVYLPTTQAGLRRVRESGSAAEEGTPAHAVTPAMREWYVEGDQEELEFAALTEAAQASLRHLAADPSAARRRVVLAADVPEGQVQPCAGSARSAVTLGGAVPLASVVSVHLDEPDAEPVIAAAVAALDDADRGADDAAFLLDEAEGCDLLWYDITELDHLV